MKRKHLGIFLCVIAIVGVLFTVVLQKKDSKSEIFSYVRENQAHLSQFVSDAMEVGKIVSTYRNWSVFMMVILVHGKQLRNAEELWKMLYI